MAYTSRGRGSLGEGTGSIPTLTPVPNRRLDIWNSDTGSTRTVVITSGGQVQTVNIPALGGFSLFDGTFETVTSTDGSGLLLYAYAPFEGPPSFPNVAAGSSGAVPTAQQYTAVTPSAIGNGMAGIGAKGLVYAPSKTGVVVLDISWAGNTTPDWSAQVRYGTGTPPAQGAAAVGTAIGSVFAVNDGGVTYLHHRVVITGLTLSTTYWFDLAITGYTTGAWSVVDATVLET